MLAYSTVSQLGYMFLAVGTGAYEAAIFLMVAHAFFKALLFLGAGSVIHGLHDEQDLKRMGNLRRYMKLTFVTFGVGRLAIAGIPPLSGFFAKGDVLDNAFARYQALWAIGLVTAGAHRVLHDPARGPGLLRRRPLAPARASARRRDAGPRRGRPSRTSRPWVMALPLVVLAVLALVGGVLHLPWHHAAGPAGLAGARCSARAVSMPTSRRATLWALGDRRRRGGPGRAGGVASPLWSRRAEPARSSSRPCCSGRYYLDDIYDAVDRPARARPSPASAPR